MFLRKWRGSHNQKVMVFANGFTPDDANGFPGPEVNVIITGSGPQGWIISTKGQPLLQKQVKQLTEDVAEITGVQPADGFDMLCKNVDW